MTNKTRYKDMNNEYIYVGDVLFVQQYPDKTHGYKYEGVVERDDDGDIVITYYDIGIEESIPLCIFPKAGREHYSEKQQYQYWKTKLLGSEPDESLYRRKIYRI